MCVIFCYSVATRGQGPLSAPSPHPEDEWCPARLRSRTVDGVRDLGPGVDTRDWN